MALIKIACSKYNDIERNSVISDQIAFLGKFIQRIIVKCNNLQSILYVH